MGVARACEGGGALARAPGRGWRACARRRGGGRAMGEGGTGGVAHVREGEKCKRIFVYPLFVQCKR